MDVVNDLICLTDMRYDAHIEFALICAKICTNFVHCKSDGLLYLLQILKLLDLIVRELILGRDQDALVTEQLLSFLLINYLLWRLLGSIEA